ncbi:MAG: hypothetical protein F6K19_35055 [Cyanothece sp. SIO1E1]|nr:hypothetical protein [Cyanothece sp. SIO1E1]
MNIDDQSKQIQALIDQNKNDRARLQQRIDALIQELRLILQRLNSRNGEPPQGPSISDG